MELRLSSTAKRRRIKTVQFFYQFTDTKDSDHPGHIKTDR
jgi:hypothetical protein